MTSSVLIALATDDGLLFVDDEGAVADHQFAGEPVVSVSIAGPWCFAAVDGRGVLRRRDDGAWDHLGLVGDRVWVVAGCVDGTAYAGVEPAALWRVDASGAEELGGLRSVDGFDEWHSPWGPADLCSVVVDGDRVLVGVEIGGVAVSHDGGRTWEARCTGLFDDVHTVLADGDRLYASTGLGVFRSNDEGRSWFWEQEGVDRGYTQGLALSGGRLLAAGASGPPSIWGADGPEAAIFVTEASPAQFRWELALEGFDGNIDRQCLAAAGLLVVAGTDAGELISSPDAGRTWSMRTGLPAIRSVALP